MDIAYAAGLFDGEGYVRANIWRKPNSEHVRYQVVAGIGMTFSPVILALRSTFGGSVKMNRHDMRGQNNRIQFCWYISSQIAASFFRQVLPHLIVKRDEVILALELQNSIDKYCHQLGHHHKFHPQRDEIFAYRGNIASQMTALKKRRFSPLVDSDPVTTHAAR